MTKSRQRERKKKQPERDRQRVVHFSQEMDNRRNRRNAWLAQTFGAKDTYTEPEELSADDIYDSFGTEKEFAKLTERDQRLGLQRAEHYRLGIERRDAWLVEHFGVKEQYSDFELEEACDACPLLAADLDYNPEVVAKIDKIFETGKQVDISNLTKDEFVARYRKTNDLE